MNVGKSFQNVTKRNVHPYVPAKFNRNNYFQHSIYSIGMPCGYICVYIYIKDHDFFFFLSFTSTNGIEEWQQWLFSDANFLQIQERYKQREHVYIIALDKAERLMGSMVFLSLQLQYMPKLSFLRNLKRRWSFFPSV